MYENMNPNEFEPRESREEAYSYTVSPSSPEIAPRKTRKGMTGGKIVALALICSLLGGCLGAGGAMLAAKSDHPTVILQGDREIQVTQGVVNTASVNTSKRLDATEVYTANVNSTVGITVGITTNYWGYQSTSAASGSGFILSENGYVLTNYHVIEDANSVKVSTFDNKSYDAKIIGYDESNDIAVLKIEETGLQPVVLGNSDALQVGETVVAIGNPLGELTFSLTQGVVSALDREITLSSGTTMTLIQTDAAINNGNSGGPLFNMYGEVIGITNAKYSSNSSQASIDNIGFAIPVNRVMNIVRSIIDNGYIVKPYIGVSVATVTSELQSYGIPKGAAVKVIGEGSPAETAGLKVNDVITKVNDTDITTSSDLVNAIGRTTPGDELTLTVYRQGERDLLTLTLTVGEQQKDALARSSEQTETQQQQQQQGTPYYYSPFGGFPFGFNFG